MAISFNDFQKKQESVSVRLDKNKADVSKEELKLPDLTKKDDTTRSHLTWLFIAGLFGLILLSGVYVIWHNNSLIELSIRAKEKDLNLPLEEFKLLSFESIYSQIFNTFGTSLGFIIGYYFKEKTSR